ncbi:hypothetical protein [Dipodfec virus UOA04_Rod_720]|nr:hypothetical protein [Dipodfec virus UOA04_Rod_720]
MEKILKIFEAITSLPRAWRYVVIAGAAAIAVAFLCSSCARSTIRFKGTGDVEYQYRGSSGPEFSTSSER